MSDALEPESFPHPSNYYLTRSSTLFFVHFAPRSEVTTKARSDRWKVNDRQVYTKLTQRAIRAFKMSIAELSDDVSNNLIHHGIR